MFAGAASVVAIFLAVAPGAVEGTYDPELAILTLTLVGLIWYTCLTYESVAGARREALKRDEDARRRRRRQAVTLRADATKLGRAFRRIQVDHSRPGALASQVVQGYAATVTEIVRAAIEVEGPESQGLSEDALEADRAFHQWRTTDEVARAAWELANRCEAIVSKCEATIAQSLDTGRKPTASRLLPEAREPMAHVRFAHSRLEDIHLDVRATRSTEEIRAQVVEFVQRRTRHRLKGPCPLRWLSGEMARELHAGQSATLVLGQLSAGPAPPIVLTVACCEGASPWVVSQAVSLRDSSGGLHEGFAIRVEFTSREAPAPASIWVAFAARGSHEDNPDEPRVATLLADSSERAVEVDPLIPDWPQQLEEVDDGP